MKPNYALIMAALLGLNATAALAQDQDPPPRRERPVPPQERGERPERPRFRPPLMAALDANNDGVLDQTEIGNASAALRKLDLNADGQLTPDELRPPGRPGGGAAGTRPDRPEGPRGPGRPRPPAEP